MSRLNAIFVVLWERMTRRMRSIRRRILVTVSVVYLLCSSISAAWIYFEISHEVDELFDAEMIQQAKTLAVMVAEPAQQQLVAGQQQVVIPSLDQHDYENKLAYRIEGVGEGWQLYSDNAPTQQQLPFHEGFSSYRVSDQYWHVFGMTTTNGSARVLLFQEDDFRAELRSDLAVDTIVPVLLLLPFMLWLGWVAINRSFQSFARLSSALRHRQPNDYSAFPPANDGEEVELVKHSLNYYLARIEQTFAREKRFSADAAHELRTPLAALKVRLQRLLDANAVPQADDLEELLQSTNRIINLVESLLVLAKVDNVVAVHGSDNIAKTLRQVLADNYHRIDAKNLQSDVQIPTKLTCQGEHSYWYLLFSNLIDNAIKYAPQGSELTVTFTPNTLTICNALGADHAIDIERVSERFYRGRQLNVEGAGLGLSIVENLAQQLGVDVFYKKGVQTPVQTGVQTGVGPGSAPLSTFCCELRLRHVV